MVLAIEPSTVKVSCVEGNEAVDGTSKVRVVALASFLSRSRKDDGLGNSTVIGRTAEVLLRVHLESKHEFQCELACQGCVRASITRARGYQTTTTTTPRWTTLRSNHHRVDPCLPFTMPQLGRNVRSIHVAPWVFSPSSLLSDDASLSSLPFEPDRYAF